MKDRNPEFVEYNERVINCHYKDGLSSVCVMHRACDSNTGVVGESGWVERYVLEKEVVNVDPIEVGSVNTGYNGG